MKTKQKSVRVFEIITDDYDKLTSLIEKKGVLLKKFLLLVKTDNQQIKDYFKDKDFEVRFVKKDFEASNEKIEDDNVKVVKEVVKEVVEVEKVVKKVTKPQIFDKIIRSGDEVKSENKLVFLKRINDGARVYSSSEIEIFDEVMGLVICDGEYMIIKKAKEGKVIFHNETLPEIKKLSFISKDGIKELE